MVNKLKHNFNRLFDDMFIEKQRQLDNLKEYNDRLHVIETEFRLACKSITVKPVAVLGFFFGGGRSFDIITSHI